MKKILIVMAIVTLAGTAAAQKGNPFLREWNTPYGVPPFDQIKVEHYLPAIEAGIKQQNAEIKAITSNKQAPTFENTILALEYSGALLNKVAGVFFNLTECLNSPEMEAVAEKAYPLMSRHSDNISLNSKLFARVKAVYDQRNSLNLNPEQMRLLEMTYKGFVRGGANVPVDQQARFREINEQLAVLTMQFGNNVLKATNAYKLVIDNAADLAGLPQGQIDAAREAANADPATRGKYVFTIHVPSMEPFLMNCRDRALRKELWTAYATRCTSGEFDNSQIINQIVNLRLERAHILGYPSHAAYVLDDCMAKTPEAVDNLLMQVWEPALAKAKQEAYEYQRMMFADGINEPLQPYDWRYYSERLRKERYDLDDDSIRPYFSLDNVTNGIFTCCKNLYGITFRHNPDIPTYHPDAIPYEVLENGKVIAIVYADYYPRESKRSGAWMTNFREQEIRDGQNIIPIVSLVFNFTKPTQDKPALLNFDEAETYFHEFGHSLHSIFSKCTYRSLAGTSVSRDFVELPSQFFEHWCREPEVMRMYAKHYKTGAVIPDSLMEKIGAAATYGQGFINTELLAASFLDMRYYSITEPQEIRVADFERDAMNAIGLIPEILPRYRSTYFQHVFTTGYDAGYYSYTWAAVLDNDAFEPFKEQGVFNRQVAKSFRTNILEKGNTEDAMTLYKRYRGAEPSIDPLLRNRGLK
ncbi:MAG: M3 family metallopeptidase [Bacteroidales bacterium]|nr:M3 family metallopeptidase [Bacteroidales bacterium]